MKKLSIILLLTISVSSVFSQGDCATFVQLCTAGPVAGACSNGTNDTELAAAFDGCLAGESGTQSYWYTLCTSTAGTIRFVINPSGAGNDYDFAVWGPNSPCPPTSAPLRCSFAAGGGNTGCHSANNAPQTDVTEGGGGNKWVQDIAAAANECYVILINNYGGGSNNFSITNSGTAGLVCSALPVELLDWEAKICGRNVCCKWNTAAEIGNDFFTVERSSDGVNFEIAAIVDGAGNSSSVRHYNSVDHSPYDGTSYYRLKWTHFNGSSNYSDIRTVDFYGSSGEEGSFEIFPNPNDGSGINISLNIGGGEEVMVGVYDATGREAYSKVIVTQDTGNMYAIDPGRKLAPGIYIVSISSQQRVYRQKMVIK